MYLFRVLNTPLGGGGGAATQTFAPGGKYPHAATGQYVYKRQFKFLVLNIPAC